MKPWQERFCEDVLTRLCEKLEEHEGVENDGDMQLCERVVDYVHLDLQQVVEGATAIAGAKA